MALGDHPHVFRHEGRTWVSTATREVALAQLQQQRAWDAAHADLHRWWIAIAVGAVAGVAGTLVLGTAAGLAPAVYLLLLPIGFGVGAVLGALVTKRFSSPELHHAPLPVRPSTVLLTQIPARVARDAPPECTAAELIEWSARGFVR